MGIGKNIASYRKAKGLTQDELGTMFGVTNQAVSKWESEVSMPDIMLLPDLVKALDTDFAHLYGADESEAAEESQNPDSIPELAYTALHRATDKLWTKGDFQGCNIVNTEERINYRKKLMKNDTHRIACISNTHGSVVLTDTFSFVDITYKSSDSSDVFLSKRISRILSVLADDNSRKIYAYMYKQAFEHSKSSNGASQKTLHEISSDCGFTIEITEKALDELSKIGLIEEASDSYADNIYYFIIANGVYAHAIFSLAKILAKDPIYLAVRDTSMLSDGCFF